MFHRKRQNWMYLILIKNKTNKFKASVPSNSVSKNQTMNLGAL